MEQDLVLRAEIDDWLVYSSSLQIACVRAKLDDWLHQAECIGGHKIQLERKANAISAPPGCTPYVSPLLVHFKPFSIMNDDLQNSIGYLVKSIAFYIAVLAFKELVQFTSTFFDPLQPMQRNYESSPSRYQSWRS